MNEMVMWILIALAVPVAIIVLMYLIAIPFWLLAVTDEVIDTIIDEVKRR